MSALGEYLDLASDPQKKQLLREQYAEASNDGSIHCVCGRIRALTMAFRCLYCGVYFCRSCAEIHFGMTIQDWIVERRKERRRQLDAVLCYMGEGI
jgi:hypothetical protein